MNLQQRSVLLRREEIVKASCLTKVMSKSLEQSHLANNVLVFKLPGQLFGHKTKYVLNDINWKYYDDYSKCTKYNSWTRFCQNNP